jgi:hypothetical protein
VLFDAIRRHVASKADLQLARYVEPYGGGGLSRLERVGAGEPVEFIARGPAGRTWSPGAVLTVGSPLGGPGKVILQDPPPGQIGASAVQAQRLAVPRAIGPPLLTALQPGLFQSNLADQPATVLGAGFRDGHGLAVVRFDPSTNTLPADERFAIHDLVVVSPQRIDFVLDIGPDVPGGHVFDLALVLP